MKYSIIGDEDAIWTWTDESTNQNRAGRICLADMVKPELDGFHCPHPWCGEMLRTQKAGLHLSRNPRNVAHVLFGRNVIGAVVAEPAFGHDISDEDPWLVLGPVDYVWLACGIGANVLFFIRKIIVIAYGYALRFYGWGYDRERLREIARKQSSGKLQLFFTCINNLIRVMIISSIVILVCWRAVIPLLTVFLVRVVLPVVK